MNFSKVIAGSAAALIFIAPSIGSAAATRSADATPAMVKKVSPNKASVTRVSAKRKGDESRLAGAASAAFLIGGLVAAGVLVAVVTDS